MRLIPGWFRNIRQRSVTAPAGRPVRAEAHPGARPITIEPAARQRGVSTHGSSRPSTACISQDAILLHGNVTQDRPCGDRLVHCALHPTRRSRRHAALRTRDSDGRELAFRAAGPPRHPLPPRGRAAEHVAAGGLPGPVQRRCGAGAGGRPRGRRRGAAAGGPGRRVVAIRAELRSAVRQDGARIVQRSGAADAPVQHQHPREPEAGAAGCGRRRAAAGAAPRCRTDSRPWSARTARASRAARRAGWRSRAPSSGTRRSCCSTSRPRGWIRPPNWRCWTGWRR